MAGIRDNLADIDLQLSHALCYAELNDPTRGFCWRGTRSHCCLLNALFLIVRQPPSDGTQNATICIEAGSSGEGVLGVIFRHLLGYRAACESAGPVSAA